MDRLIKFCHDDSRKLDHAPRHFCAHSVERSAVADFDTEHFYVWRYKLEPFGQLQRVAQTDAVSRVVMVLTDARVWPSYSSDGPDIMATHAAIDEHQPLAAIQHLE
jgi:hypothetical protein